MVTGVGNSGIYYNHYNPDTAVDEASASLLLKQKVLLQVEYT